jgi:5S rRNA maturation endonuclease (ribonuclease M5)
MAFVYKRNKVYYVGYYVTALDDKGNKIRKQVSECVGSDRQAAIEFCARKTLSKYTDKNRTFKKDIPIQKFYDEYRKNYSIKNKRASTLR